MPSGVRIAALSDRDYRDPSLVSLWCAVDAEARQAPGSQARNPADTLSAHFAQPRHGVATQGWVARSREREVLGVACVTRRDSAALRGVGKFDIRVLAAHRRRGIGSLLWRRIRAWAPANSVYLLY
ncbi:MAG TPA: GNAT family N-acetyltransferase, partial [Actinopolymorphaceae bacterium]|nr:GNAT family N-acetyltransferase [Actinopolymorphaceae bacterium]